MTPLWKSDAVALVAAVRTKDVSPAKSAPARRTKQDGARQSLCVPAGINAAMLAQ